MTGGDLVCISAVVRTPRGERHRPPAGRAERVVRPPPALLPHSADTAVRAAAAQIGATGLCGIPPPPLRCCHPATDRRTKWAARARRSRVRQCLLLLAVSGDSPAAG